MRIFYRLEHFCLSLTIKILHLQVLHKCHTDVSYKDQHDKWCEKSENDKISYFLEIEFGGPEKGRFKFDEKCLLGAGILGHSLGTFADGVLSQFTG